MKNFTRENTLFSLCGLNCGLCPMRLGGYCPGCGGGAGNQPCKIARCAMERGRPEYCIACPEFPCGLYADADKYDSFISHRNCLRDLRRARELGIDRYNAELTQKMQALRFLLENYNDGRRKRLFCTAVNLLDLEDVQWVLRQISEEAPADGGPVKERAEVAAARLGERARARGISLKRRGRPATARDEKPTGGKKNGI